MKHTPPVSLTPTMQAALQSLERFGGIHRGQLTADEKRLAKTLCQRGLADRVDGYIQINANGRAALRGGGS